MTPTASFSCSGVSVRLSPAFRPRVRLQRDHTAMFAVTDRLTDRFLAEPGYFYDKTTVTKDHIIDPMRSAIFRFPDPLQSIAYHLFPAL